MARTRYLLPVRELLASDLVVDIFPRGYVEWLGSRAQLEGEGLLPERFVWPEPGQDMQWRASGFDFCLRPGRLSDTQHGAVAWAEGECWSLRRTVSGHRDDMFFAARDYRRRIELEEERWLQSPAGARLRRDYVTAQLDERFQLFKLRVMAGSGS